MNEPRASAIWRWRVIGASLMYIALTLAVATLATPPTPPTPCPLVFNAFSCRWRKRCQARAYGLG